MKVDVILPAAGRISGAFAQEAGAEIKTLIQLDGKTVLERTISILRATEGIGKIVVVGPNELASQSSAQGADAVLPEGGPSGTDNIFHGMEWLYRANGNQHAERVLILTTDLPFITPEAIAGFIKSCPAEMDICVPVIERAQFKSRFPEIDIFNVPLRDGRWSIGCVFLLNPKAIAAHRAIINKVFAARKSPVAMARLLGPMFIFRYLFRRLTVAHIEKRCQYLLRCSACGIKHCAPELAFDIDGPVEFRYAVQHYAASGKGEAP
jgi:2-C-methyl-D-erythritol 4-phosphate cytidylyltransferase